MRLGWPFIIATLWAAGALAPLHIAVPPVMAQEQADLRRPQLSAATSDAIDALRRDILSSSVTPDLTIQQLLERSGNTDRFLKTLDSAEQRGGTRWPDDLTCEIRLEIAGADVAGALEKLLPANLARLDISSEALERGLRRLRRQTFSALGKSTAASNLTRLRPSPALEAWRAVSDEARKEALLTARSNAVARVIESLRPLPLPGGSTLDEAIGNPQVAAELRQWLTDRPVTAVEFRNDLEVRLTLSTPPDELFAELRQILSRHGIVGTQSDAKAWDRLQDQVMHLPMPAVGRGTAVAVTTSTAPNVRAFVLPAQPPPWAARQIDADGSASGAGLKSARAAESIALSKLREQINALPIGQSTVGEAAKANPRIEQMIADLVRRSPTSKVEYQKGLVKVKVSLDLGLLWGLLRNAQ